MVDREVFSGWQWWSGYWVIAGLVCSCPVRRSSSCVTATRRLVHYLSRQVLSAPLYANSTRAIRQTALLIPLNAYLLGREAMTARKTCHTACVTAKLICHRQSFCAAHWGDSDATSVVAKRPSNLLNLRRRPHLLEERKATQLTSEFTASNQNTALHEAIAQARVHGHCKRIIPRGRTSRKRLPTNACTIFYVVFLTVLSARYIEISRIPANRKLNEPLRCDKMVANISNSDAKTREPLQESRTPAVRKERISNRFMLV